MIPDSKDPVETVLENGMILANINELVHDSNKSASMLFNSHHTLCNHPNQIVGEGNGCTCRRTHRSEWEALEADRDDWKARAEAAEAVCSAAADWWDQHEYVIREATDAGEPDWVDAAFTIDGIREKERKAGRRPGEG